MYLQNHVHSNILLGMFFIYIESILLTFSPDLANNWLFCFVFAFLIIPILNGLMVFCFFAQWMDVNWYYTPIDMFNLVTYLLFCVMTFIYLIFCLIGSCMCCYTISNKKGKCLFTITIQRTMRTFIDMWLLLPYALVPCIMYGPSFGFTSIGFITKHLMKWLMNSGFLEGDHDMTWALDFMSTALNLLPWFVLLFPLVHLYIGIIFYYNYRFKRFSASMTKKNELLI
uniref:Uncharacterized protein n=1 Tax=Heterorhabditis bacteriophora TaxID=37862 RepID=A0A1I7WYA7_HETBA